MSDRQAQQPPRVAIVHDYLTQRGGAERVVISMTKAFPSAELYTSLFEPASTFEAFSSATVRPMPLNRLGLLRRHHRLALPFLAPAFERLRPDADVLLCSSSGWAHGAGPGIPKVVYCYAPARWLYQTTRYLSDRPGAASVMLRALRPYLARWDKAAAERADRYVTSSRAMQALIRATYGRDAEILPPPQTLDPNGRQTPVAALDGGFVLCVSRLLPYKNVDRVIEAFRGFPGEQLAIVGDGPQAAELRSSAGANVHFLGSVTDAELRWLYASSRAVVAASYEDFGLTPLEAASFGRPAAVLRYGGFLDTVEPDVTGVLFHEPDPDAIREALSRLLATSWDESTLREHAGRYSEESFSARLRAIVTDTAAGAA